MPEGRGTFVNLTVEENLRLGAYSRKDKGAVSADFDRVYQHFPVLARVRQATHLLGQLQSVRAAPGQHIQSMRKHVRTPVALRDEGCYMLLRAFPEGDDRLCCLLCLDHADGCLLSLCREGKPSVAA